MRAREFLKEQAMPAVAPPVEDPAESDSLYPLKLAIANKIKVMPPDEQTRKALQEIEDLLSHVNAGGKKGHISTELKTIEDRDVNRAISLLAKYVHSLDMTAQQRADLFTRWRNDELVNQDVLLTPGKHTMSEIVNGYGDAKNPAIKELTDDLSQVATLGQGKGEFLLSVLSKSITKRHKGDLEIDGQNIEVKTQDVGGGRFYDQEVRPAQGFAAAVQNFRKLWAEDIKYAFPKVASTGLKLIDLIDLSEHVDVTKKNTYWQSVEEVLSNIFPGMDISNILNAMQVGNIGAALQSYAVTNLDFYRSIKTEDAGILFIDLSKPLAEFVFFRDAAELASGGLRLHAQTVYPVTADPRNAYPQMRIITTKGGAPVETSTAVAPAAKVAKPKAAPAAPSAPAPTPASVVNKNRTMKAGIVPMGQEAPPEST
jgi:hypothetical protein